ncbi:TOMM precursor leader peptide-binding protein [Actinocorallia aurantiaca]|uniref:TOMM leader peptide-binding protein n=1 Tax=Actinocorallia aurantiaca TaxID=46204 RepID=A0ABN3UNX1_9ACTN
MRPTDDRTIGFRRHLRAETVRGEGVYLVSAQRTTVLSGAYAERIAPLLDGTRTVAEVRALCGLPEDRFGTMIGDLLAAGLVSCRDRAPSDPAADAYWDLAGASEPGAPVLGLAVLGGADPAAVRAACEDSGLAVARDGADAPFTLVVCEDYLSPELAAFNAARLADGRPWLLARPCGAEPWTGPVFRPGAGPCWSCLAVRLRGHRRAEQLAYRGRRPLRLPDASLPATRVIGLQTAVLEAAKWLAGVRHEGQDGIFSLDTLTLRSALHPVAARPQCPDCGDPGLVAAKVLAPPRPGARAKAAASGNGHRALTAEAVWERFGGLADPVSGVVSEVARDPRSPSFLHCYRSGPNLAFSGGGLALHRAGLRMQSGGKGRTDAEARVSALCEAVERYSGTRSGDEPTVRGSYRELAPEAVHPAECLLYDDRQYADRDRWNSVGDPFQYVPEPFDEDAPTDWTPVWSLAGGRRLLPTDLLYYRPGGGGLASVRADSNGTAAGGTLEDAILQGFLELVERDAVALWWYNRTRHAAVDPASSADPWVRELPARFAGLGRSLRVLDLTSDLGVPVAAAVSHRTGGPAEDIMLGFGAHFDPEVALSRAVTELGQLLPAVADGYAPGLPARLTDWWRRARLADHPYLVPDPVPPARDVAGMAGPDAYRDTGDLRDDLDRIRALAARHGLEVLVLDQTRPDLGMPVVRVVVPGLRHFWARFGPGRLFDAPVRLGRLAAPTAYADLNPVPLFL